MGAIFSDLTNMHFVFSDSKEKNVNTLFFTSQTKHTNRVLKVFLRYIKTGCLLTICPVHTKGLQGYVNVIQLSQNCDSSFEISKYTN